MLLLAVDDASSLTPILTVVGAVVVAILAAYLANRFTLRRERRAELTRSLDAALLAFTSAEYRFRKLVSAVTPPRDDYHDVMAAADAVSLHEIEMRAAMRSIRLRLYDDTHVVQMLRTAEHLFSECYMLLGPAIAGVTSRDAHAAIDEAVAHFDDYLEAMEAVVILTREVVGSMDDVPLLVRIAFWRRSKFDDSDELDDAE